MSSSVARVAATPRAALLLQHARYDGFGNRWEQAVTKGTAPGNVVSFDQATNRINYSGYSHDANGNMLATPTVSGMTYDVENRLLTASGNGSVEEFAYLGDNKRVWKKATAGGSPVEQYYLYGVGGQRIATYSAVYSGGTLSLTYANKEVYFGGRVIWQNGKAVVQDRLGSVMARGNGTGGVETHDYFPFGEERAATVGDRNKFGTYHRDQTGLDYADQRYYNSAIGRFLTSDPYEASGGAAKPGSWGRGVYVSNDPINLLDPRGLYDRQPDRTRRYPNVGDDGSGTGSVDGCVDDRSSPNDCGDGGGPANEAEGESEPPNPCDEIGGKIDLLVNSVRGSNASDPKGLLQRLRQMRWMSSESDEWKGHKRQIEIRRPELNKWLESWDDNDCGPRPPGADDAMSLEILSREVVTARAAQNIQTAQFVTASVAAYGLYRAIRLLPSLVPLMWWTLPANIVVP